MLYKFTTAIIISAFVLIGTACKSSFVVENVDYTQRIESVLSPDDDGMIHDIRHGISFNVLPFQFQEFHDSSSVYIEEVRLIRNSRGYYFITADNFNHVYVMEPEAGKLKLKKKIKVAEDGLRSPAFNMRDSVVELVEMETEYVLTLNADGVQKENREEQS